MENGAVCSISPPPPKEVLLILLLGLPGAGKSSCARRLISHLNFFNSLSVEFDDNVFVDFESPHRSQWKEKRHEILCSVQRLIETWNTEQFNADCAHLIIQKSSQFKPDLPLALVLDDNFYYRSMRKDYFRLSRNQKCRFATLSLNLPLEVCIEKNSSRDTPVPDSVLIKMHSHFEWPDGNAHPWEQNNFEVTSLDPDFDAIESFLWRVYTNPIVYLDLKRIALERQKDREINEASVTHRLDTVLRNLVRTCILSLPLDHQTRYGNSLNKVRKVTMLQLKPLVEQHIGDDSFDLWILGAFKENVKKELPSLQICFE